MPKSMFNLISLLTQNQSLNLILNQTLIQNPTMTLPMFNGWSAQIMEKMITTLFQDIKMLEMVSSTTDGLTHSVGLTVAMMMNMFFFNMQNLKAQQRSTSESSIKLLSPDSRMLVMASNIMDGPILSAGLIMVMMMKQFSSSLKPMEVLYKQTYKILIFFNMLSLKDQQRSTSESSIKLLSPDSRMLVMASNITDGPILSAGLTTVKMMKSSSFNRNKILKSEDEAIRQTKNKCN